jgi:hypothetical protein
MDGAWHRASVSVQDVDHTRDDRAHSLKDTRRKERRAMTTHTIGTRQEWLAARLELLEAEKELTRRTGVYFRVDDVDAAYKALSTRGYTFNEEPYDIPVGRLVTLNDPDGNIVGLEDRSKGGLPGE